MPRGEPLGREGNGGAVYKRVASVVWKEAVPTQGSSIASTRKEAPSPLINAARV